MDFQELVKVFKAMGHVNRMRIIEILSSEKEGVHVGFFVEKLGIMPNTLSHHVRELKNAGLIKTKQKDKWIFLTLNKSLLSQAIKLIQKWK